MICLRIFRMQIKIIFVRHSMKSVKAVFCKWQIFSPIQLYGCIRLRGHGVEVEVPGAVLPSAWRGLLITHVETNQRCDLRARPSWELLHGDTRSSIRPLLHSFAHSFIQSLRAFSVDDLEGTASSVFASDTNRSICSPFFLWP